MAVHEAGKDLTLAKLNGQLEAAGHAVVDARRYLKDAREWMSKRQRATAQY